MLVVCALMASSKLIKHNFTTEEKYNHTWIHLMAHYCEICLFSYMSGNLHEYNFT